MQRETALDIAVGRGIISHAQANSIRLIETEIGSSKSEEIQSDYPDDEEGIRFASGFGDLFIALGIGTLLYGILQTALSASVLGFAAVSVICWILAEIVCRWQQRSLPGIVVSVGFVLSSCAAAYYYLSENHPNTFFDRLDLMVLTQDRLIWILPLLLFASSLIFYFRFKLPFSLFLSAIGFAGSVVLGIYSTVNIVEFSTIIIPCLVLAGLSIFAVAIYFDASDRTRKTSRADNAFWLHLVASPLIVHSIMWQSAIWITDTNGLSLLAINQAAGPLSLIVLLIFVTLMFLALVIDRRAMLVSSLVYVTLAVTYLGSESGGFAATTSFVPIILGGGILSVGISWQTLRKIVFKILPLSPVEPYLSPIK